MTRFAALPGWYAVSKAGALRSRPAQCILAGTALTLVRTSDDTVCATEIMSGHRRDCREAGGLIFAAHDEPTSDALPEADEISSGFSRAVLDGKVRACIGDVGENILDTTHTSVVHKDYLRRPDARRPVTPQIETGADWISATYSSGAAPSGWGARLLGAQAFTIRDTFRAPSVAEVHYSEHGRTAFAARFYLTPVGPSETYVAASLSVRGRGPAATLKLSALRLFFLRIFAEDRAILELIAANRVSHGKAPLVYAPQDVLRPGIEAILAGRRPLSPSRPVALKV